MFCSEWHITLHFIISRSSAQGRVCFLNILNLKKYLLVTFVKIKVQKKLLAIIKKLTIFFEMSDFKAQTMLNDSLSIFWV